jgi:hypothetical protein
MSESREMVERVARAISRELISHQTVNKETLARLKMFALARAAIEEMREPTKAMLTALDSMAVCEDYILEGWVLAIDAALGR